MHAHTHVHEHGRMQGNTIGDGCGENKKQGTQKEGVEGRVGVGGKWDPEEEGTRGA